MWLSILLTAAALLGAASSDNSSCFQAVYPPVLLSGVAFPLKINLSPFLRNTNAVPLLVNVSVYSSKDGNLSLLLNASITTRLSDGTAQLSTVFNGITVDEYGYQTLVVEVTDDSDNSASLSFDCSALTKVLLVIPGWLTILPPIITTFVAIIFKQVILALLLGIWVGALFANECNPVTAALRTLDTYFVRSYASKQYAPIIASAILIGGLIAVVQKSGGAFGMAKLIRRFASSHRKACLACFLLSICIFFDDFVATLVIGYTSRKVMSEARVSKDKVAFMIRSMAYTMTGLVPLTSAVGGQIGYILSGFSNPSCGSSSVDGYLILIETLPYRFLPLLMIACVLLVALIKRDFGPMLTSERHAHQYNGVSQDEDSFDVSLAIKGPLAPKPQTPKRWINGILPFVVMIGGCMTGMLVSGYVSINYHNSQHLRQTSENMINVTLVNILSNGDALSAILWGTFLGTLLLLVMVLAQRILSFREFMMAWMEGVKDMTEPILILLLSFAFGYVIEDVQASNFIAQGLSGGLPPEYIPAITSIIGYIISYAVGAAFGGLGILFPLIIPIVCQLTPGDDNSNTLRVQTAAAILSSTVLGTLMSPMAPHTILVKASTGCEISSHLKSTSLYVLLVGGLAVLLGALPVGAGWYPWYVGWILMVAALVVIFLLFSSGHSTSSRSLCRIGCPCLFSLATKLLRSLSNVRESVMQQCFKRPNLQIQDTYLEDQHTYSITNCCKRSQLLSFCQK